MKETILLIKATMSLMDGTAKRSRNLFIGVLIAFTVILFILIGITEQKKDYSGIIINFMNLLNFSALYSIGFGYIIRNNKSNFKSDIVQFIAQLPIGKRNFSGAKFIYICIGMLPCVIILICLNIFSDIKGLTGIDGYIGFCTLLLCVQILVLSSVSGFNPYLNSKKVVSNLQNFMAILPIFLIASIIFVTIGLNNEEIYYGIFGSGFSGFFMKLEFIAGIPGAIAVIITLIAGYLLGCLIPDKLFSKRGWSV